MLKRSPAEQLDLAISALLARPRQRSVPRPSPSIAKIVTLARSLRNLPRPEFRSALKADLQRRTSMKNSSSIPALKKPAQFRRPTSRTSHPISFTVLRNSSNSLSPPSKAPSASASRALTVPSCTPK